MAARWRRKYATCSPSNARGLLTTEDLTELKGYRPGFWNELLPFLEVRLGQASSANDEASSSEVFL